MPDDPMPDFPDTIDLDGEFWTMNDPFPSQHYLASLTLGNDSGLFGEEREWSPETHRFA